MKVHNTLGNGFQEVVYQRCLAIELSKSGLILPGKLNKLFIMMGLRLVKEELTLSSKIKLL